MSAATPPAPSGSPFRNRDFAKLWTAATISLFGTQVSQIAIPVIAVLVLKVPPFQVAVLGTLEFLPFLLFTLPAGVWVDRLPRRLVLVSGDLGRAAMLATIPIAYLLGALTIWQLYVIAFVNGTLTVFFDIADGQRFALGIRYLRSLAATTGTANLFSYISLGIFPVFVYVNLGLTPETFGIIGGSFGAGALVGALIGSRVASTFGVGRAIAGAAVAFSPAGLLVPLAA